MVIQKFKEQMKLDISSIKSLEEEINYTHGRIKNISISRDTFRLIGQKAIDVKVICKKLRRGDIIGTSTHHKLEENKIICIEEMAELIDAITTMESCKEDSALADSRLHILEEMADVAICLQLLKNMYNFSEEELEKAIRVKCENYRRKIEQE